MRISTETYHFYEWLILEKKITADDFKQLTVIEINQLEKDYKELRKGLIMPWNVDTVGVIQDIARKTAPPTTVTERPSDPNFGYCSNCNRAERLRTWNDYKYCPVCGHKISKGGGR